jgi:YbgC/YbaW family acyl-CoA thioester hydrolase
MPLIHKRMFRVRHYECDAYGHVNHANYLRYMQETALDASAAVGYDEARYLAMGTLWLIRETDIEYLCALRYGDSVEVVTWVGDFRRVRSRRFYELRHTDTGEHRLGLPGTGNRQTARRAAGNDRRLCAAKDQRRRLC